MAKYNSPMSVEYRKPIVLDYNDPKAIGQNLEAFRSKAGAEVIVRNAVFESIDLAEYVEVTNWLSVIDTDRGSSASASDGTNIFMVFQDYGSGPTIVKYNSDGDIVWQKQLSGYSSYMTIFSIALDSSGNIYLVGYVPTSPYQSGCIIKLNSSAVLQWAKTLSIFENNFFCVSVETDNFDNIYVGTSGPLIKINGSGSVIWQKDYSTTGFGFDQLKMTNSGNIIAAGIDYNDGTYYRHIYSINSSGTVNWAKLISIPSTNSWAPSEIAIDSLDNIYYGYQSSYYSVVFVKISSSGSLIWDFNLYGNDNGIDGNTFSIFDVPSIVIDSSDNIYFASPANIPPEYGSSNIAILKFTPSGSTSFQKIMGTLGNNYLITLQVGPNSTIFLGEKSEIYDEGTSSYNYKYILSNISDVFTNVSGTHTVASTSVHFLNISPEINLVSGGNTLSDLTVTSSDTTMSLDTSSLFTISDDTLTYTTGKF